MVGWYQPIKHLPPDSIEHIEPFFHKVWRGHKKPIRSVPRGQDLQILIHCKDHTEVDYHLPWRCSQVKYRWFLWLWNLEMKENYVKLIIFSNQGLHCYDVKQTLQRDGFVATIHTDSADVSPCFHLRAPANGLCRFVLSNQQMVQTDQAEVGYASFSISH